MLMLPYFQLGGPFIPLKTGRRDGRRSRAEILEEYLPDHNESMSTVLEKFSAMGIDTPGVVALLGMTRQIYSLNDVLVCISCGEICKNNTNTFCELS